MTKYIVANWKANKSEKETIEWFIEVASFDFSKLKDIEVITCLPYVFLSIAKQEIIKNQLPIKLGAENVSRFEDGPYTGVVTVGMLKDIVSYVMLGHSERRKLLKETDELVLQKVQICVKNNLRPIICVSNMSQVKFLEKEFKKDLIKDNSLILFEPIEAIGSGKAISLEYVVELINSIKKVSGDLPVLYGGSVTSENVSTYLSSPDIDGVAIGGASLDPQSFIRILENATKA